MKGKIVKFLKCRSLFALLILFMAVAGYGIYKYGTGAEAANEHKHDMSAECGQGSAVTFTEWTKTDRLPDTAGNYFLSNNVTLEDAWTVPSGTVNLCLNGYQIKLKAPTENVWRQKNGVVKLTGKAKLNLCDCSADKRGKINGEKKEGIPRHTGIYINDAEFNMYGGQITGNTGCYMTGPNNSSLICGGGLYVESGKVHLYGGSITENTVSDCGAGIYAVSNSEIVMHSENAKISNNRSVQTNNGSSSGAGGGIYLEGSSLSLKQGIISDNEAGCDGGGICAKDGSTIQIEGGTILNNKAQQGGGIFAREGNTLLFSGGNIQGNEAGGGGGLFLFKNDITMSGGKIFQNKALGSIGAKGGGILLMGGGTFRMSSGEICGNASALSAGGVYIDDSSSSFTMTGGIISENKAEGSGGGVLISAGTAELSGQAKIQRNETKSYGGGVSISEDGSFAMKGGEISGNICGAKGGGIYVTGTFVLYDSSVIKDNKDKYTNSTNVLLWTNCKITIGGALGDTISKNPVGVSIYNSGTGIFTEGWTNKMSGQNVEDFFAAEQPDYQVSLKDGEGFIDFPGYSLTYVIPENEGISGTVPETARYPRNTRIDMDESKNTLTKKGYTHIGWKWQERERIPVTYVLMSMSKKLYPVFSRNFTVEDTRIESKVGEAVDSLDLNKLVSFDEGVTETEKNFQFEIDETSQLPKGLTLENGMISGTPEKAGETGVAIKVQDKAVNGQSRRFVLTFDVEKGNQQEGRGSISQKNLYCGEKPSPVPESETNGTGHVTYYYKAAAAADTEYTTAAPTAAGSYIVRAVFAETDVYKEVTAEAQFAISHKYGETWETDKASHWHGCVCGVKKDTEAHIEDAGTVTKKPSVKEPGERTYKCNKCGYVLRTEEIKKLEKQEGRGKVTQKDLHCGEKPVPVAESETNGTKHVTYYYKAAVAADTEYTKEAPTTAGSYIVRAVFAETDVYKEVTAEARFTISHKYGETWEKDKASHWHECVCGAKKDTEAHIEDAGTVTKEPSAKEPGERTFKCGACGYVLRTEEIPALNTGNLEKEIQTGDGVPDIRVPAPPEELADIVLTQEEQESVEKGADIKIILTITDAENLVSNAEKEIVQKALNGYEKGQYLDISLFKQIDGVQSRIVKAKGNIRIVMEIPEQLRKENADSRAFAVIRVHDGKAVWLEDLDNDKNTITIETDCFSTYVLAYRDGDKTDDDKPDDNKPDNSKPDDNKPDDNKGDKEKLDGNTAGTDGKGSHAVNQGSEKAERDGSVKTGDSAKTAFWLVAAIFSGTACPLLYSAIRKKRKEN